MIITPKDGPAVNPVGGAKLVERQGMDGAMARAKALLAKLESPQAQAEAPQADAGPTHRGLEVPQPNVQKDTIETPQEAAPAETKAPSEESLSSHYATLARKEKAIRQREQQLRAREQAAKAADEAKAAPKAPTFDESQYVRKDKLLDDTFGTLTELGLTYDELTERAMNAPKPEQLAVLAELKALKAEIAALKGETENTKKSFQDSQTLQETQAINTIRNEAKSLIKFNPEFETIKATGSVEDVVDLIKTVYDTDGILLSVEDAAQQVEEYLVEEATKLAKLSKIQQRLQPKATQAATKTTAQPQQSQLKTLTNNISTTRQLSARERAILAFEGKLK